MKRTTNYFASAVAISLLFAMLSVSIPRTIYAQVPTAAAYVYQDRVRFTAPSEGHEWRVEVFSPDGMKLFSSGFITSQAVDWNMQDSNGLGVGEGLYAYTFTVKDKNGKKSKSASGSVAIIATAQSRDQAPPLTVQAASAVTPTAVSKPLKGAGTVGQISKWTDVDELGDSVITQSGNNIGMGTMAPTANLHIEGLQPAASPGNGANADRLLQVSGGKGGNTTGTGGQTAGKGADVMIQAGAGGIAPAGSTNGAGGNVVIQPGAPGEGGGGAGAAGSVSIAPNGGNAAIGNASSAVTVPGTLTVGGAINGNLTGNAATATNANHATVADNANNANAVTNGVYATGSYADPPWITSLAGSKISGLQISESQVTNLLPDLALKANDSAIVHLAGTEAVTGAKTFSGFQTFTGNIGVGQHGPSSTTLLNVGGNTGVVSGTFINNHNTSANDALLAVHTGIGNAFHAQNTQAGGRAGFFETGHPSNSAPTLETLAQGVGPALKASNTSTGPAAIFASGNVGIGTASPSQKLDVAGNIIASGSVSAASFIGNGSGLTGISSMSLNCTGCIGNTQLADGAVTSPKIGAGAVGTSQLANNAVNANHIADGAVTASKIGGGQIVKSLNNLKDDITLAAGSNITLTPLGNTLTIAATVPASSGWSLAGNSFTNPTTNFLGTTDDVAQEFRVNNQRALRLEPNTTPNLIGGFSGNTVTQGALGATISGGGGANNLNRVTDTFGTVGGGYANLAGDNAGTTGDRQFATVAGGRSNTASGEASTVGGGFFNIAQLIYNTVGGGFSNSAVGEGSTIAGGMGNTTNSRAGAVGGGEVNFSGGLATVAGGQYNNAYGGWSTIPGGSSNTAGGEYSFAAGRNAQINGAHSGAFLFSDSNNFAFSSAAANEFAVRATGGFRFVTGIDATGNPTSIWSLSSSGIRFPDGTTQTTAAVGNGGVTGVTAGTGLTGGGTGGNVTLGIANGGITAAQIAAGAVSATQIADNAVSSSKIPSGQVVKGLNGLTDAVTLAAGSNITITSSGHNTLTIAADGGGTAVQTTGSYTDPSWITSLSGSKITGSITNTSIFSRTNSNNDVIFGANDGYGTGVHGFSTGGYGVAGYTNSNVSAGVYGSNPVGDAGRFDGNVIVSRKVGIGTASLGATLEIKGPGASLVRLEPSGGGTEDNQLIFGAAAPSQNRSMIVASGSGGDDNGDLRFVTNLANGPAVTAMTLRSSGNVGIGTTSPGATLEVMAGGTTLADAWTTRSSARFKTNVQPIIAPLDKVLQLRGVTFDWKDTQKSSIGFIAEEVARVLPQAVEFEKNGKDAKGLDYNKLTPLLVEAIKSQQKTLEELRQENARLQIRNAEQEARLNRLEVMVKAMIQESSATPASVGGNSFKPFGTWSKVF